MGIAFGDLDRVDNQVVGIVVKTVDRRPLRHGQHRAQLDRERSGNPRADDLQEEGLVKLGGQGPFAQDAGHPTADDKAVADLIAHGHGEGRIAKVEGNGLLRFAAEQALPFSVPLEDGRFVKRNPLLFVQLVEHRGGIAGVDQHLVPIHVDLEMGRGDRAHLGYLLIDIPPGARLGFERGIAFGQRIFGFLGQRFGRKINIPPGNRHGFAHLGLIEKVVGRHIERLAHDIVDRHLQPCAQGIIAQEFGGIFALDARNRLIGDAPPGVVGQRFTIADDTGIGRHADDLADTPLPDLTCVPLFTAWRHRCAYGDAFNVSNN